MVYPSKQVSKKYNTVGWRRVSQRQPETDVENEHENIGSALIMKIEPSVYSNEQLECGVFHRAIDFHF